MLKNVELNPLRWLPLAYDRSRNAPRNLVPSNDGNQWTAYNWKEPECGTPKPKARTGHGTLFLCWDGHTSPSKIPAVKKAAKDLKMGIVFTNGDLGDNSISGPPLGPEYEGLTSPRRRNPPGFILFRNHKRPAFSTAPLPDEHEQSRQKTFLGPKTMDIWPSADVFCDAKPDDPWYGPIMIAQSRSDVGLEALKRIASNTEPGKSVLVEHDSKTIDIEDTDNDLSLCIITGLGDDSIPETNARDLVLGDFSGHANHRRDLATRFHLYQNSVEVARCHVSYRDGSSKSTIGPTIEMIETAASHRGRGHLRRLLRMVEMHFFEIWRLRRLPGHFADGRRFGDAGQKGYIMKATYLLDQHVEQKKTRGLHQGSAITDKKFLIDCGFQTRHDILEGRSPLVQSVLSRRPADEEMMKYVVTAELPASSRDVEKVCICENCKTEGPVDTRKKCKRCHCVRYCSVACQKEDWPFHKLWCNKSPGSIMKKLVALNLFEENEELGRVDRTSDFLFGEALASEVEAVYNALKIEPGDPRRKNP